MTITKDTIIGDILTIHIHRTFVPILPQLRRAVKDKIRTLQPTTPA